MKRVQGGSGRSSALLLQARQCHGAGDFAGAFGLWQQVIAAEPERVEAYVALADLSRRSGRPSAALDLLDRAARLAPADAGVRVMQAGTLLDLGATDRAAMVIDEILNRKPRHAGALRLRGLLAQCRGNADDALIWFEKAVRADRQDPQAHIALGIALMGARRVRDALPHFTRAVVLCPHDPAVHLNQAQALLDAGLPEKSLTASTRALGLDPGLAGARVLQARAFDALENFPRAREAWLAAVALAPDDARILSDAATFLSYDNDTALALNLMEKARSLQPDNAVLRENAIALLIADGRLDEAEALVEAWITESPGSATPVRVKGDILVRRGAFGEAQTVLAEAIARFPEDDAIAVSFSATGRMEAGIAAADTILRRAGKRLENAESPTPDLGYAAGKILVDRGDHQAGFRFYEAANRARMRESAFDIERHEAFVAEIQETFTPALFERLSRIGNSSDVPVFVVGLPRSGTTLTEQVIAGHSRAAGAGEMPHFTRFERSLRWLVGDGALPYPACAAGLTSAALDPLAKTYLEAMGRLGGDAARIVDKLPNNFLRLGLIALMFPNARIVHLNRNVLDTCVSLYFTNFVYAHAYRHDLRVLGRYVRAYQRLMDHWRTVLPGKIYDLHYEALVHDPEPQARALFNHLGLDWEPEVLSFHRRREQPIATASRWQVRQPISTGSVERWRRYERELSPLIEELQLVDG